MRRAKIFSIALLLASGLLPSVSAQEPEAFTFAGSDGGLAASLGEVQSWQVTVRPAALRSGPQKLEIPLAGGAMREAVLSDFETRGQNDFTWRGRLVDGQGRVTLTVKGAELAGFIEDGDVTYEIIPRGRGLSSVVLVDAGRFPDHAAPLEPRRAAGREATDSPMTPLSRDSQSRIDVMVVYSPAARAVAGTTESIKAMAQAAIDAANTVYADSGITTRLRLRHSSEVAYIEGKEYSDHLTWLASDPTVAGLRDVHRADLVALLVNDSRQCGMAYQMSEADPGFKSSAFSVATLGCAVGNLGLARELGRNLGVRYDPDRAGASQSLAEIRESEATINAADEVAANFATVGPASDFYTLPPCRVVDTRTTSSPLTTGTTRTFPTAGVCGIPADATAVALNVTAVEATTTGAIKLYPSDVASSDVEQVHFVPGTNRANNTILPMPSNGSGTLSAQATINGGGTVGLVYDVFGYFGMSVADAWEEEPALPVGVAAAASVVVNGKLYVIGGRLGNGQVVSTVYIYDPATRTWTTGCSMPTARSFASAAAVDGKIYVFGGRTTLLGIPINLSLVHRFDPAAATCATAWTLRSLMLVGMSQATATTVNGKIYLAGGLLNSQLVFEYNPDLDIWLPRAIIPVPKIDAASVAIGGKIYVMGGQGSAATSVVVFDPAANTWSSRTPMPVASGGLAAAVVGTKIYVIGGTTSATQEYTPATDTWVLRASLLTNRSLAAVGVLDGIIHVVGGISGGTVLDVHEIYYPPLQ